jgi:hypothetical protein
MKNDVLTPSLATSSVLYGGVPKSFSKIILEVSRSLTAMPICSIFLIVVKCVAAIIVKVKRIQDY